MNFTNIGDLVQSMQLRRDTARVKGDLERLTGEMASGKRAELNKVLRGQFGPLAGINRSLALNTASLEGNGTAARLADGQQIALDAVQSLVGTAGPAMLGVSAQGTDLQRGVIAGEASNQFRQAVAALNTQIEDKALFGGAALGRSALADAGTMLSDLETALTGVTGPADAIVIVSDWFDAPGGGFETIAYQGAAAPMSDIPIGMGETARLDITAADPALRDGLRGLAIGALVDRGLFDGDRAAQRAMMQHAGETLVASSDGITARRAALGFVESRVEAVRVRIDAETAGLQKARAALVEADPYDTALRLQDVQLQLETIYAVTARVSSLSLARILG